MIRSMTGYGKGQASAEGTSVAVEIKAVNHRYSDVTVKSPRLMFPWEGEIKKKIGERLKRGKIDVFISQELAEGAALVPKLNLALAAAYVEIFEELRTRLPVDGGIPVALVANQKDVVILREGEPAEEALRGCLDEALVQALTAIEGMRQAEGEATCRDMEGRLTTVGELLGRIEERAPLVPQEWREKLQERLQRLAGDVAFDPQRVAQELAVFADRCDISEEIVRFRSHVEQFRQLLDSVEPVGRQLDFLVQEMNREVNTMGSKSNDADLTRQVVALKSELEKIREQVQNVE